MAAKRNTRHNQHKKSLPWGPMLLGFIVGAFIMFLMHLNDNVAPDEQKKASTNKEVQHKKNSIEPTFDFYTLLPEMEVIVDKPTPPHQAIVTATTQPSPASLETEQAISTTSYMLQVGSFRNINDADGFRARLAFLGIESTVQTVTIDNKDTWHRVQVGPIKGREKADALQKQLKQNNIDSLLMRAKHS